MSATKESVMQALLDSMEKLATPYGGDWASVESYARSYECLSRCASSTTPSKPAGLDSGTALKSAGVEIVDRIGAEMLRRKTEKQALPKEASVPPGGFWNIARDLGAKIGYEEDGDQSWEFIDLFTPAGRIRVWSDPDVASITFTEPA